MIASRLELTSQAFAVQMLTFLAVFQRSSRIFLWHMQTKSELYPAVTDDGWQA